MALKIWRRMPCTSDATAITVVTPMTTPRIVRVERSLFARIASSAMAIPSPKLWTITRSLDPERGDGIQPSGPGRGINPEDEARPRTQRERDGNRPHGDPGGKRGEARHAPREAPPAHDAQPPAQRGEDQRPHKEPPPHAAAARRAGSGTHLHPPPARPHPPTTPSSPPREVRTSASTRNCRRMSRRVA